MSDPRNRKKRPWEELREVEHIIDFVSKNFPDDKNLPKRWEGANTMLKFQNETQIWILNQRKRLDELSQLMRKLLPIGVRIDG